jgi:hypothetical protein
VEDHKVHVYDPGLANPGFVLPQISYLYLVEKGCEGEGSSPLVPFFCHKHNSLITTKTLSHEFSCQKSQKTSCAGTPFVLNCPEGFNRAISILTDAPDRQGNFFRVPRAFG